MQVNELAQFQAALLDLLASNLAPEQIEQRLHEDRAFAPFRVYVREFEPRMLAVAVELVEKWGRRQMRDEG